MHKYPNLPGVSVFLSDAGEQIPLDSGLPKTLVFGTIENDYFADGTPIQFNEPYNIGSIRAISEMFKGNGTLNSALTQVALGASTLTEPVAVRIGYPTLTSPTEIDLEDIVLRDGTGYSTVTSESLSVTGRTFTFAHMPIVPTSVKLIVDGVLVYDDGQGNLSDGGNINYATGECNLSPYAEEPTLVTLEQYLYDDSILTMVTKVENENVTLTGEGPFTATLANIPLEGHLTFTSTEGNFHDNGEGDILDSANAEAGTINYSTKAVSFTTTKTSLKANYIYRSTNVMLEANVTYVPSFNSDIVFKVIKAQDENAALEGGRVNISYNGGISYQYFDVDMSEPIFLKELGIGFTFTAGTVKAEVGYTWSLRVEVKRTPQDNSELYKALEDAYGIVEGVDASLVVASGIALDDTISNVSKAVAYGDPDWEGTPFSNSTTSNELNFGYQLARFCYKNSTMNHMCMGVIGVSEPPAYNLGAMKAWASALQNLSFLKSGTEYGYAKGFYLTSNNKMTGAVISDEAQKPIDIGAYIFPIMAWGKIVGSSGIVNAAPYLGSYMFYRVEDKYVNVDIPSTFEIVYSIPRSILNTMVAARFTVVYPEFRNATKTSKAAVLRTGAGENSSYTKLSTVKIINEVADNLRNIANKYLGRPNSVQNRESMKTEMQSAINAGAELGKYASGYINIESTGTDLTMGIINVFAVLRAYAEIHDVNIFLTYEYASE